MELREPDASDTQRVREVARSAITASYALSPQQIETIVEEEFNNERLVRLFDSSDTVGFVAENGVDEESNAIVGLVIGGLDGDAGEIRWLLVDPEHRGNGIGTALFETTVDTLRDRDVKWVQANTLEANAEGAQFFERFDYVRTEERSIEIGTSRSWSTSTPSRRSLVRRPTLRRRMLAKSSSRTPRSRMAS